MQRGKTSIIMPVLLPDPWQKYFGMTSYCIKAIQMFTPPDDYELIVIEAGEREMKSSIKDLLRPTDTYISFKENYPQSTSLNLGVEKSQGEYICLISNDVFVCSNWLENLKKYLDNSNCSFVGGFFYRENYNDYQQRLNKFKENPLSNPAASFVEITFSATLFTRKVYEEIGKFDEKMPFMKWDQDYNNRIKKANKRCGIAIDVPITHVHSTTWFFNKTPEGIDNYWEGESVDKEVAYYNKKWEI